MAICSISCSDPDTYQIGQKALEKIHNITNENNAALKLLIDWICECNGSLEREEDRERIVPILFLLSRSTKKVMNLLPGL